MELTTAEIANIRAKAARWKHGPAHRHTFTGGPLHGLRFTTSGDPEYVDIAHLRDEGRLLIVYRRGGGGV